MGTLPTSITKKKTERERENSSDLKTHPLNIPNISS